MNVKCPKCETEFPIALSASIPKTQTVYLTLESQSDFMSARLIGRKIAAMESLLVNVAKDLGTKVAVCVSSMKLSKGKVKIGFTIATVDPKSKKA